MNLTELSEIVAKNMNLDKELVRSVTLELKDEMVRQLKGGQSIKIRDVGRLFWRLASAKKIKSPSTGITTEYPARYKLSLRPSKGLKRSE